MYKDGSLIYLFGQTTTSYCIVTVPSFFFNNFCSCIANCLRKMKMLAQQKLLSSIFDIIDSINLNIKQQILILLEETNVIEWKCIFKLLQRQ